MLPNSVPVFLSVLPKLAPGLPKLNAILTSSQRIGDDFERDPAAVNGRDGQRSGPELFVDGRAGDA